MEVAVGFTLQKPIATKDIDSAVAGGVAGYAEVLEEVGATVDFDPARKQFSAKSEDKGKRLVSKDQTDILMLHDTELVVAKLAPYPGWDAFYERTIRDLDWFRKNLGVHPFSRIGLRFINRIDIPKQEIVPSRFLNCYVAVPDFGQKTIGPYIFNAEYRLDEDRLLVARISSGLVDPPVPRTRSLLLDIDVGLNKDLPMRVDAIGEVLHELRAIKNDIFEKLVTDQSRELFNE